MSVAPEIGGEGWPFGWVIANVHDASGPMRVIRNAVFGSRGGFVEEGASVNRTAVIGESASEGDALPATATMAASTTPK